MNTSPLLLPSINNNRSVVLRELAPRTDRIPRDQRVDVPEIQESFRVNFSNAALAAAIGPLRNAVLRPGFTDSRGADPDPRLLAYHRVGVL